MSTQTCSAPQRSLLGRLGWRPAVIIVAALLAVISMAGIFTSAPANAAVVSLAQCNDQIPGSGSLGATTIMNCDILVANTINGGLRSSVVTISRTCADDPCTGSTSQSFTDVVTNIAQCNNSDNDASHPINCNVTVTNTISADTPGAQPISAATVNQCVGSGADLCDPTPASTTGATVTQCNGSGNGGASGTVDCSVDPTSTISAAIPIQINQCNLSGNAGANFLTCTTQIHTVITAAVVTPTTAPPTTTPPTTTPTTTAPTTTPTGAPASAPASSPASTPVTTAPTAAGSTAPAVLGVPVTPGSGTTPTGTTDTAGLPTTPVTVPQVAIVPTGGVQTGGGSTAGLQHVALLTVSIGLLLAAGFSGLLRRRFVRGS